MLFDTLPFAGSILYTKSDERESFGCKIEIITESLPFLRSHERLSGNAKKILLTFLVLYVLFVHFNDSGLALVSKVDKLMVVKIRSVSFLRLGVNSPLSYFGQSRTIPPFAVMAPIYDAIF